MPLNWTTTDRAAALHGVKILVYGRSGSGKTRLCATAPAPVILSAESGLLSMKDVSIPVIQIRTVEDLIEAHRWLVGAREAAQFQTICIDSITEIGEVVLANAKAQVKDPRQAYGELIEKMINTIKSFRDIYGKHVYMSAKVERVKDEATGLLLNQPAMPGSKVGPSLPYYFDEVFYLGVAKTPQGVQYSYLQTKLDNQYDAKDRSGALDPIERPDLTYVINKILGASKP